MKLNGIWKLYYGQQGSCQVNSPMELKNAGMDSVSCLVPGNVELDLAAAGVLPPDLFKGENILEAEQYETYEWWYETRFTAPAQPDQDKRMILHFGAVDCIADYYLNGEKIGSSDNMFMAWDFDVTDRLHYEEENLLHVHISSAIIHSTSYEVEPNQAAFTWHTTTPSLNVRKAPHSFGWDIMPRAVSAGIWREVELRTEEKYGFRYLYFQLDKIEETSFQTKGTIRMMFDSSLKPEYIFAPLTYVISGRCGASEFSYSCPYKGGGGRIIFEIEDMKLWWPRYYGEPNLYDITVQVYDQKGNLVHQKSVRRGFRTMELQHSDIVEKGGKFQFVVNGIKIMTVGTNWVPLDVYHSRDYERCQKALELAWDIGCNIIRCWGGNVYEDHEFFDFCDTHGILVWQDFAMACHYYAQNHRFAEWIEKEAEWVVKELRDHPSLALWSGDNEIDRVSGYVGADPSKNYISREILPRIIERLDPYRPYIASSPYISPKAYQMGNEYLPEDHLWGSRDYYKSDFYKNSKAYYVSETGYHGCPSKKSIEKFIDSEYVWPYFNNPQWNLHSTMQDGSSARVMLMHKQVKQLFGDVPTEMEDYILASQICQAEAQKYFIERVRAKMERMGGVIWWNLIDGWPQLSDAVVDYYYEKKLAYDYIQRSSRDFIILLDEMENWGQSILGANSSLQSVKGSCTIIDLESEKTVFEQAFIAAPNANTVIGKLELMYSDKGMFLIKWKLEDGRTFFNTYLYGSPAFSLEKYKQWLSKLERIAKE